MKLPPFKVKATNEVINSLGDDSHSITSLFMKISPNIIGLKIEKKMKEEMNFIRFNE